MSIFINSLLFCSQLSVGAQGPSADQIVRESLANVRAAKTIQGQVTIGETNKMTGSFSLAKPDCFSLALGDQIFDYDGSVFWQYTAKTKSGLRWKEPISAAYQILFVMGFDPLFGQPPAPAIRYDMTQWNGKAVAEKVIDDAPDSRTRIFFDPETKLPCGFDQMHGTYLFTAQYSDVRLNVAADPKSFSFTPPADAKITSVPDFALFMPGMSAPDFTLKTPAGSKLNLRTMVNGHKATLLNFWFVGCGPCREEYPHLQRLYTDLGQKGLQIVSVNNGDPSEAVRKFLTDHSYTFPVCLSKSEDVVKTYNVNAFPTNYVLDGKGKVIDSFTGFDRGRLYAALKKAGLDVAEIEKKP